MDGDEAVTEVVKRTTKQQGLPERIEDKGLAMEVAKVLGAAKKSEAQSAAGSADAHGRQGAGTADGRQPSPSKKVTPKKAQVAKGKRPKKA